MNFPCPKCNVQVSETAVACPSCGQSFLVDMVGGPTGPALGPGTPFGGGAPVAFGGGPPPPMAPSPFPTYGAPPARGVPGVPTVPIGDVDDAGNAVLVALLSLFCFAPAALASLHLANRSATNAARLGRPTPKYLTLARVLSYVALVLWGFGLAVKLAGFARR